MLDLFVYLESVLDHFLFPDGVLFRGPCFHRTALMINVICAVVFHSQILVEAKPGNKQGKLAAGQCNVNL